jgi:fatty-acid desaturase
MSTSGVPVSGVRAGAQPLLDGKEPRSQSLLVHTFVVLPMLALVTAVPLAWGWGLSWLDVGLAVGFYFLSGFGVAAGFHRYFTHDSPHSSGPASCASQCCTTSPGRSTRSATWSATGPGPAATAPPSSGHWPSPRWPSPGTTLHHADPSCARHGVKRGQIDMTARLIWAFEKLGWTHDVRWPTARRLVRLTATRDPWG